MTFIVPARVYRTDDGRLVRHGDLEAAFLAFPAGTELSDEEARRLGVLAFFGEKNRKAVPENKMAARPDDKTKIPVASKDGVK